MLVFPHSWSGLYALYAALIDVDGGGLNLRCRE